MLSRLTPVATLHELVDWSIEIIIYIVVGFLTVDVMPQINSFHLSSSQKFEAMQITVTCAHRVWWRWLSTGSLENDVCRGVARRHNSPGAESLWGHRMTAWHLKVLPRAPPNLVTLLDVCLYPVVCLRGGERGTCLGPPLFGGPPLRYYAHKFSLFFVKDVLFTHVMCYKANHKQVFCFQTGPLQKL